MNIDFHLPGFLFFTDIPNRRMHDSHVSLWKAATGDNIYGI